MLFEPGVGGACDVCGELYGSDAKFCSHCGAPTSGAPAAEPAPGHAAVDFPVVVRNRMTKSRSYLLAEVIDGEPNAETRIVYRQESDQLGATSAALGLTGTEQSLIPTLGTGQGLWRIKHRSFVVQHQMHPAELDLFDTTGRMTGGPSS